MNCEKHDCNDRTELPNSRINNGKWPGRWSGIWIGVCFKCGADVIDHSRSQMAWHWRDIFLISESP